MEEKYKELELNKLKLVSVNQELEFITQTSESYKVYGYESQSMGWFYNLIDAKNALDKHIETDSKVFAYEIRGPEHGYGEPNLEIDWDNTSNEDEEDIKSDESPEFDFLYDKNKKLISSYFYDEKNPGGERLKGEKSFNKGEMAYVRDTIYVGKNQYDLLIPIEIEGKVTQEYLVAKWRNAIKETHKQLYGEDFIGEPSEDRIQFEIDKLLNIQRDSLIFKPLVTVKCNWGTEPNIPFDDAARIEFIAFSLIK